MDDEAEFVRQQTWARDIAHRQYEEQETPEQMHADRDRLKRRFGGLYQDVLAIIQRHDPIQIAFVADDEYEPEVDTILLRLGDAHSEDEIRRVVYEEFAWWFADSKAQSWQERLAGANDIAGSEEKYREIAHDIWLLLRSKGESND
jgi:hypothetical protein